MGPVPGGNPVIAPPSSPTDFDVFVSVYGNQQHFMYRDTTGNIQDVYYDGNNWNLQQLTGTKATLGNEPIVNNAGVNNAGPPAASDVFVSVYGNQQHIIYRDTTGNIQDVYYDGNNWNLLQLTGLNAPTCPQPPLCTAKNSIINNAGPPPAGNVFASVYNNQLHVMYRDTTGNIQDVSYNGNNSNLQQLTGTQPTLGNEPIVSNAGPPAAGDAFVSVFTGELHDIYRDTTGNIQDVYYDGNNWNLQQLTGTQPTLGTEHIVSNAGPPAAGDAFALAYHTPSVAFVPGVTEHHVMYRDITGNIQDVWYDAIKNEWNLQQLTGTQPTLATEPIVNNAGVNTAGPPPAGNVFAFNYTNPPLYTSSAMHVIYKDTFSSIQEVWHDGEVWGLQQITGVTPTCPKPTLCTHNEAIQFFDGPVPAGNIFVSEYNLQEHFTYRDINNNIQDLWYGGGWHLQQLAGQ